MPNEPTEDDPIVTGHDDDDETPAEGVPVAPPPITNADLYEAILKGQHLAARSLRRTDELTDLVQNELVPRLDRLDTRVFGSKPPPLIIYPPSVPPMNGELAMPAPKPSTPPLTKRATLSEGAIETLGQELSNLRAEIRDRDAARAAELGAQSKVLGISPAAAAGDVAATARTVHRVQRRNRLKDTAQVLTLVLAAIAGIAGILNQFRAPPPSLPAPSSSAAAGP